MLFEKIRKMFSVPQLQDAIKVAFVTGATYLVILSLLHYQMGQDTRKEYQVFLLMWIGYFPVICLQSIIILKAKKKLKTIFEPGFYSTMLIGIFFISLAGLSDTPYYSLLGWICWIVTFMFLAQIFRGWGIGVGFVLGIVYGAHYSGGMKTDTEVMQICQVLLLLYGIGNAIELIGSKLYGIALPKSKKSKTNA